MNNSECTKAKILIVDDIVENVELLKVLLQTNYSLSCAYNGEEALMRVDEFNPDLILLDVMLPKINGYDVCYKLKSNAKTRNIMIIMITALVEAENELKGVEVGADDYLFKPFNKTILKARISSLLKTKHFNDELEKAESIIKSLAFSIEAKDPYTEGHCERLSINSFKLGKKLNLDSKYLNALKSGGILHDIGKIGIPDSILLKKSKLTNKEMEMMRQHPIIGIRICKSLHSLKLVIPIIHHHHEKYNGTGYPSGLKGEKIPITARVLQIVDIYDSLTTNRPYKKAINSDMALNIMAKEVNKGWWDRDIFIEFKKMVELNNYCFNSPV